MNSKDLHNMFVEQRGNHPHQAGATGSAVHSFCPTQIRKTLDTLEFKNKGTQTELDEYRTNWLNWTHRFSGTEKFTEWAVCNGIHDAIVNQVAYRSNTVNKFYYFADDYLF